MTRPREILLATIGSYGDVLPFITLGGTLVERGYDVTLMTSGYFSEMAEQVGIKIAPVGTARQYIDFTSNPDWTHPIRGLRLNTTMLRQVIEPAFNYISQDWRKPSQIIIANSHCIPARIAQEKYHLPMISINLAAITLGSHIYPPTVNLRLLPENLPRWLRGIYGRTVHKVTNYYIGGPANEFRKKIGLEPIRNVMKWWHSPQGVLSLFPDWFSPHGADWPANHECVGFPVLQYSDKSLDHEIEQLLSIDKQPLLFVPGTTASNLSSYAKVCSEVCQKLDRNGIMLAPAAAHEQSYSSNRLRVRSFIPLPAVLPRVAVAIHHGGIGTVAACLRAGVPQLIRPTFADQPDNAACTVRLGVAKALDTSQFRSAAVVKAVSSLLEDPLVAARCKDYQRRLQGVDGIQVAVDRIEAFGEQTSREAQVIHV
jgi:rhamnosyltransferase subunit B